jgi:hypothetical protein
MPTQLGPVNTDSPCLQTPDENCLQMCSFSFIVNGLKSKSTEISLCLIRLGIRKEYIRDLGITYRSVLSFNTLTTLSLLEVALATP